EFLMKGIELANDCDLKFKSSKNQRLLVELTLMQLASITFDGEKKNSSHYIIPASYFKAKGITPIAVTLPKKEAPISNTVAEPIEARTIAQEKPNVLVQPVVPKIDLKPDPKRTSGLSLKSIRAKKEHLIKQMEVVIDPNDLPKEDFTPEAFHKAWEDYVKSLDQKGEKIMVSILEMSKPKLKGTEIQVEFPNESLKIELERAQFPLMEHLRKAVKNYDLTLHVEVNEEAAKQYAFTPLDKYEKLKEKNPNIELLRKTFGLDI
ncbi:MAG TPA: hypothetical protein VLZ86_04480, partial [Gelidibacter sp.]|nr:hypothetical protein [Gelidibacter sp.]